MIRFEPNSLNNLIVTLSELQEGECLYYKMEVTNQQSLDKTYTILNKDLSQYKQRYNQFYVIVSEDNNHGLNHNLQLINGGLYDYKIYQTTLTEEQFNELSDASEADEFLLLEQGLIVLEYTPPSEITYNPIDTDTIIYQPE